MKRTSTLLCFLLLICLISPMTLYAAIPDADIENYLSAIHWDVEDLEGYLNIFDKTLDDFANVQELQAFVGTPITAENRQQLLTKHGLTLEELDAMLGQFGDTLEDYVFYEDLEMAIEFYQNYGDELEEIVDLFDLFGISEEEFDKLLIHLSKLDEDVLAQKMTTIETRLVQIGDFENSSDLTTVQKVELSDIFTEMLAAINLHASFYLEIEHGRSEATMAQLLNLDGIDGHVLLVELFDYDRNFILDMRLTDEVFDSAIFTGFGHVLPDIPELAHDHPFGAKMPITASGHLGQMFLGFLLSTATVLYYKKRRSKEVVS